MTLEDRESDDARSEVAADLVADRVSDHGGDEDDAAMIAYAAAGGGDWIASITACMPEAIPRAAAQESDKLGRCESPQSPTTPYGR